MPSPSGSTSHYGFPYLLESDVPDVATASQQLATAVENVVDARIGVVEMFAGSSAPTGALLCQGQAVSRSTYASLFAIIGTTWGTGDGSTTFNLPDFRGVSPIGAGTGTHSGTTARTVAAFYGAETHQITSSEVPAHTHPAYIDPSSGGGTGFQLLYTIAGVGTTFLTGSTEGTGYLNFSNNSSANIKASAAATASTPIIGPSLGINFIIWAN